jgi:S1-C subfamily serine protease
MADQDPRVCPKCGRRVPRAVATCRCGAVLPAEVAPAVDEQPERSQPWLIYIALVALVAGAAYWTYLRPPAPAIVSRNPEQTPLGDEPDQQAAGPAKRELSPEQRAWDAAARMADSKTDAAKKDQPVELSDPIITPSGSLEEMVDAAMPAVVLVETTMGRGSAFYVAHDTLITNVHVVQQDQYVTLRRMNGSSATARVQTRAPNFDIAILKVAQASTAQPYLAMATSNALRPGQEVIVIGSALGTLQNSVSRGIVSGLRNSGGVTLIQSDAAANPGNSGGPMLDRNGRVVGILTAGYREREGLNFAVSIDHARDILEGRETNLGTGQSGLANIESSAPGRSESDRRQQQGEQAFKQRVASAEQAADQLDQAWERFRSQCYKSPIRGSYAREWFVVFVPGALPGDAAAGCVSYYQGILGEMNKFRDYMRTTVQDARRANVLPGTVRDTLSSKRLTFDY